MTHALILAGGDGSRMLASGVSVPKALVAIGGQPQLRRMVEACRRVGCESVTCVVREDLEPLAVAAIADASVAVLPARTASSLHTLAAGLHAIAPGNVLCTLVDAVMPSGDWDAAHRAAMSTLQRADAAVAVTPFVDDDSPLWVDVAPDGRVRGFGVRVAPERVTGGVYWLGPRARSLAADAVAGGVMRLRGFLGHMIATGLRVHALEVAKIVDVDTSADLAVALALVEGEES